MGKHDSANLSGFQKQVCYGTLLGDSSLSCPANGTNYHLSCYHSEKQLDWLRLKWSWLQPHTRPIQICEYTDKRSGKSYRGGRFHTISARCFTELADIFYPGGEKRITRRLVRFISHPIALACLICDDGSWDGAGISIASKQFSEQENEILSDALGSAFGLSTYILVNGKYPYIRIGSASVEHAFDLCRQYIPETMYYKFGGGNYRTSLTGQVTKACSLCGSLFQSYKSARQIYCSQACAQTGKPRGYDTARPIKACPVCGKEYLAYNRRQKTCVECRDHPLPWETCVICGKPVNRRGNATCSKRCSVIAGHRARTR